MDEKAVLRAGVLAARTRRGATERARHAAALAAAAPAILDAWGARAGDVVAGYASVADEPPTRPLLDALRSYGVRVLLPVVVGRALDWTAYDGWASLRPTRWGLLEPVGPRLGSHAFARAAFVLVPSLAVDRDGHRLGRGGGYYDRVLATVPRARRVAVVYDEEVVATVPHEAHDVDVRFALTPSGLVLLAG